MVKNLKKVALVGTPNTGKSTLFNVLTGLYQKTGNFSGVTVEKKTGSLQINGEKKINLIDLPGTYSLYPQSMDEKVTFDVLSDSTNDDFPDAILIVGDATNLKRTLFLTQQVLSLGFPTFLALNMTDEALKLGIEINTSLLSERIGIPCISVSARKKTGIADLKNYLAGPIPPSLNTLNISKKDEQQSSNIIKWYKRADNISNEVIQNKNASPLKGHLTQKIDRVLTHKVWGYLIFLILLFFMFQAIFWFAPIPMNFIDTTFTNLSSFVSDHLPPSFLTDLLSNGIIPGIGGIVIFVPQIAIMFGFINLLEDSGYMARVSFIMDKLFKSLGLNGKAVIPLIGGMACAVPAIMAARTIPNMKERLIAIFITPFISCSARIPVYILIISLAVPKTNVLGIFNLQGIILMLLYIIGFAAAFITAILAKHIIPGKEKSLFIMDMPDYKTPDWKTVLITMFQKSKIFVLEAGKIILAVSIILWLLASFAPGNKFEEIENTYKKEFFTENYTEEKAVEIEAKIASEKLEASYIGQFGKFIEPAITPLGYDWKIGIALITSFAAREVFVGTIATIYGVMDPNNTSLNDKLLNAKNQKTGKPVFTLATAVSLLLFYAFALQCMSTLVIVYKETNSWKWPLIQFFFMGLIAYLSSFGAYTLLS